jgi:hypothetical protein
LRPAVGFLGVLAVEDEGYVKSTSKSKRRCEDADVFRPGYIADKSESKSIEFTARIAVRSDFDGRRVAGKIVDVLAPDAREVAGRRRDDERLGSNADELEDLPM